jgi:putative DNA primase/helicase
MQAVDIAARVSTGAEWPLGEGRAEQGTVIILSGEDAAEDTLKPRLIAAGADMNRVAFLEPVVKFEGGHRMLSLEEDRLRVRGMIEDLNRRGLNVTMLIVDPISSYMGGKRDTPKLDFGQFMRRGRAHSSCGPRYGVEFR